MRCSHAMDGKASLRAELVAARDRRTSREREQAGAALAEQALLVWQGVSAVIGYAGVGTEPPTRRLLDGFHDCGAEVWLPVVVGAELHWAPYDGWGALVETPIGLLEPTGPRSGPRPPHADALWLVPALAVDRAGVRLGRGGGFYDRALAGSAGNRHGRTAAVVYDSELVDRLPREPHDVLVDAALLPSGLVPLGAGGPDPD